MSRHDSKNDLKISAPSPIKRRADDNDDICRGLESSSDSPTKFAAFEEYYNEDNMDDDGGQFVDDGEFEAPRMPDDFYDVVDNFLSRPAPSIAKSASTNTISKTKGNLGLPKLPPTSLKLQSQDGIKLSKATSKLKDILRGRMGSEPKSIDEKLLREAFAYTEKLARDEAIETMQTNSSKEQKGVIRSANISRSEQTHQLNGYGMGYNDDYLPSSAPPQPKKTINGSKQKVVPSSKKSSGANLAKKLRNQTHNVYMDSSATTQSDTKEFGTVYNTEDPDSRRNAVDYDALVANFEQGILLQRLRSELEASKHSMNKTTEYMRKLTQDALNGR